MYSVCGITQCSIYTHPLTSDHDIHTFTSCMIVLLNLQRDFHMVGQSTRWHHAIATVRAVL